MIGQEKKRKLIYKDRLFYWYVKVEKDYYEPFLSIVSDDRKLCLIYPMNQVREKFLHPKISVLHSEKMKEGTYNFPPPIADEFISTHNVLAILNWYEKEDENTKPIDVKVPTNPFENIDFKSGIVTHIETDFSNESLREDMLQVLYPKDYLLDVGWYGISRGFMVSIIRNQDWENPVGKTQQGIMNLHEAVTCAVDMIDKLIKE